MTSFTPFSGKQTYIAVHNSNLYKGQNVQRSMIGDRSVGKKNILASIVSLALIALLVIAGPATAFSINLKDFDNKAPIQGEIIDTTFVMRFENDHEFKFNRVNVHLQSDTLDQICVFTMQGNLISAKDAPTDPDTPLVDVIPGNPNGIDPIDANVTKKIKLGNANPIDAKSVNETKIKVKKKLVLSDEAPKKVIVLDAKGITTDKGICQNITLNLMKNEDGYGYAYEPFVLTEDNETIFVSGALQYGFTIDTTNLPFGTYKSHLEITGGSDPVSSGETTFVVTEKIVDDGDDGNDDNNNGGSSDDDDDNDNDSNGGGRNARNSASNETNGTIQLGNPTGVSDEETPSSTNGFARITGAVIGTLGKAGALAVGIFLLILILATAALHVRKYMLVKPTA